MLPIVVHRRAEVPGLGVVGGPGVAPFEGSLVDEDLHAWWG